MWSFPLCAALVSGLFGALVSWQWRHKRRPNLLAWGLALTLFALASAAAFAGMLWGWTAGWYRTYYLSGAIVNVPVLGLGTIYLLAPRKTAHLCSLVVIVATILAQPRSYSPTCAQKPPRRSRRTESPRGTT